MPQTKAARLAAGYFLAANPNSVCLTLAGLLLPQVFCSARLARTRILLPARRLSAKLQRNRPVRIFPQAESI